MVALAGLAGAVTCRAQSAQDLINEMRAQARRYSGSRPPAVEYERRVETQAEREEREWNQLQAKQQKEEAERVAAQQARFASLDSQARDAFRRHDDVEGLRLMRELEAAERHAGIGDLPLREAIKKTEAILDWRNARTSAEFERARAKYPDAFTQKNLDFIDRLKALEAAEREMPARAARDRARAQQMRALIEALATTLDQADTRPVLDSGSSQVASDAFNTHKSNPHESGNPASSLEHAATLVQLGFDTPGKIYIQRSPARAALVPESRITGHDIQDPKLAEGMKVINDLQYRRIELDVQRIALIRQIHATKDPVEMNRLNGELDAKNKVYNKVLKELVDLNVQVRKQKPVPAHGSPAAGKTETKTGPKPPPSN